MQPMPSFTFLCFILPSVFKHLNFFFMNAHINSHEIFVWEDRLIILLRGREMKNHRGLAYNPGQVTRI